MDVYRAALDKLQAAAKRDYEKFKNDAKNKRAEAMKDTIVRPETQTHDVYINDHHHYDDDNNFCEATFSGWVGFHHGEECHGEEGETFIIADECSDGESQDILHAADWSSADTLKESTEIVTSLGFCHEEKDEVEPTDGRVSRESLWCMGEHYAWHLHLLGDRIHQMALPTVCEDDDSNPSGTH